MKGLSRHLDETVDVAEALLAFLSRLSAEDRQRQIDNQNWCRTFCVSKWDREATLGSFKRPAYPIRLRRMVLDSMLARIWTLTVPRLISPHLLMESDQHSSCLPWYCVWVRAGRAAASRGANQNPLTEHAPQDREIFTSRRRPDTHAFGSLTITQCARLAECYLRRRARRRSCH